MFSKAEKNYLLNIILGTVGLVCILTGILLKLKLPLLTPLLGGLKLKTIHEWMGYIMAALIVLHLLMHMQWIQVITKSVFANRNKASAVLMTIVVSISSFVGVALLSPTPPGISSTEAHHAGANPEPKPYTDGVFEGQGEGYNGTVRLSVTIQNHAIAGIELLQEDMKSCKLQEHVHPNLGEKIVENQSTTIDGISSATYSSKGYLEAVRDALNKASQPST